MKAINLGEEPGGREVLHYVGYDDDRGGIVSVVRALAGAGRFRCVLGVNRGFRQTRLPPIATAEFSPLEGESLRPLTLWRSRAVAHEVADWLRQDPDRVFHGHSRAGLAVALWLNRLLPGRVVASVHCYGRFKGFYRWAESNLPGSLYWLSPAMRQHYHPRDRSDGWQWCIPGCLADLGPEPEGRPPREPGVVRLAGIGAVVPWKQWHLVVEALALMAPALRSRFRFTHVGGCDGTTESSHYAGCLVARTADLGLTGQVEFRGPARSAQPLIAESDCLVVASRNEPFSVAMLEALAGGIPVLAADSGGARDIIRPGGNGWLFKSGDAAALACALEALADGTAIERVRVDRGALSHFSADAVAAQWEAVYSALPKPGP